MYTKRLKCKLSKSRTRCTGKLLPESLEMAYSEAIYSGTAKCVYASPYGYRIKNGSPPLGQSYYSVTPEGLVYSHTWNEREIAQAK